MPEAQLDPSLELLTTAEAGARLGVTYNSVIGCGRKAN